MKRKVFLVAVIVFCCSVALFAVEPCMKCQYVIVSFTFPFRLTSCGSPNNGEWGYETCEITGPTLGAHSCNAYGDACLYIEVY